ncbi:hypothetical protein EMPG_11865 [Blastomyces silverae]|uniref:Uncharacterized protein n=1 Tax=Blastomyces silverae TaxID=2060906 RepID=A0A0H1BVX6_9EURO|nr:hypothetical protein EMPG_11865 [Blastomyces silverae]
MPSPGSKVPKLRACDVVAFDDAELDQYLEENGRTVSVDDPENIPESFIQRLKDRVNNGSSAAKSLPIDLDQVSARLLQVATDKEPQDQQAAPRNRVVKYEDSLEGLGWTAESVCGTTPSPDPEAGRRQTLKRESEAYKALVESGGRPSHPFQNNSAELFENPGQDRELLLFWVPSSSGQEAYLFSNQWHRWKTFRKFQRFMRERNIEDERAISLYSGHDLTELRRWDSFIGRQKPVAGEEGRFPIYARAVKDRLVRHGFTRTFQLEEDPTRQDSLTTWIEYLGYEYWWYDRYALTERQQEWLDRKWKDVVASQVLKPFETQESVSGFEPIMQRYNELVRSQEVVESAKSAVILAQKAKSDPQMSRQHSLKENERRLLEAESRLAEAEKDHEFMSRREKLIGGFLRATANTRTFKENAKRHKILLKWILEQLPMIEGEMKQSKTVANALNDEPVSAKSRLNQTDHISAGDGHSGQDTNNTESLTALNRETPIATNSQARKGRKRSYDIANEEHPSKRPRRSGRKSVLPDYKISESAPGAATSEVAAEGPQNPNRPTSRMTRQKRKAATVAAEEEGNVKKDDKVSIKDSSQGRRVSNRHKRSNLTMTRSAYDKSKTADTAVPSDAAAEEGHIFNPASSRMTRQKRKAATVAAEEEGNVKKDDKVSIKDSSQGRRISKRHKRSNPTMTRSAYDKSKTADTAVPSDAAAEEGHIFNPASSRMTRQKRKAATVAAEEEGNVKKDDKVSIKDSSQGRRISKRHKRSNPTMTRSAYDKSETADIAVSRNTATDELHASGVASSRLPRQKSKTATVAASKKRNAETDEISSRGAPIRNRRKKSLPSSGAQIPSTNAKPLRRSLRIMQQKAAINVSVAAPPSENTWFPPMLTCIS